jgi:hypothetical protein
VCIIIYRQSEQKQPVTKAKIVEIRTSSGSVYHLIRESGSAKSAWIVEKNNKNMGILLCFADLRKSTSLKNTIQGKPGEAIYLNPIPIDVSTLIDEQRFAAMKGRSMIFGNIEDYRHHNGGISLAKEAAQQNPAVVTDTVMKLGRTTSVEQVDVLEYI